MAGKKYKILTISHWVHDRAVLMKLPVSMMSGCAALFGFSVYARALTPEALWAAAGVFLLSAGASALNSCQDQRIDSMMARTRSRPLPAGRMSPLHALIVSGVLLAGGIVFLCISFRPILAPLTGVSAVLLYNGLYTPLKLKTQFALIPGVACGMLPPLIGWLAAGGGLASPKIWYIMAFFGTWQVPHFWLIFLSYSADFRRLRLPNILDAFSETQLKRLVFIWSLSYAALMPLFWLFSIVQTGISSAFVLANAIAVPLVFLRILYKSGGIAKYMNLFKYINASALAMMCIAILDCALVSLV
jgi:protoheme IX farnesyltransferase